MWVERHRGDERRERRASECADQRGSDHRSSQIRRRRLLTSVPWRQLPRIAGRLILGPSIPSGQAKSAVTAYRWDRDGTTIGPITRRRRPRYPSGASPGCAARGRPITVDIRVIEDPSTAEQSCRSGVLLTQSERDPGRHLPTSACNSPMVLPLRWQLAGLTSRVGESRPPMAEIRCVPAPSELNPRPSDYP